MFYIYEDFWDYADSIWAAKEFAHRTDLWKLAKLADSWVYLDAKSFDNLTKASILSPRMHCNGWQLVLTQEEDRTVAFIKVSSHAPLATLSCEGC